MIAQNRPSSALSRPLPNLASVFKAAVQTVARWEQRRRSRRALATLDAHMLRDIGLTPGVAARETEKPFWRR